jgi:hypothetical protein
LITSKPSNNKMTVKEEGNAKILFSGKHDSALSLEEE